MFQYWDDLIDEVKLITLSTFNSIRLSMNLLLGIVEFCKYSVFSCLCYLIKCAGVPILSGVTHCAPKK